MRHLPLALVVGFALGLIGDVLGVVFATSPGMEISARVQLARTACGVSETILVGLGLLELGRHVKLVRIAGVLVFVGVLWHVARPMFDVLLRQDKRWVLDAYRAMFIASGALALATAILLAMASRAGSYAAVAIVAVIARGWIPGLGERLHFWLFEHPGVAGVYWLVVGVMWAVGVLGMTAPLAKLREPDARAAVTGLVYVSNALRIRIVGAIVFALLAIGVVPMSSTLVDFVEYGGPTVVIMTLLIVAVGCLAVARSNLPGMPRYRLAAGAALSLWWAAIQFEQVAALYRARHVPVRSHVDELVNAWSILGPLVGIAGLALVGSALARFAHVRTNDTLRESASVRTLIFVVLSASAVGIQSQLHQAETQNGILTMLVVATAAAVGALVAFAGLAKQAAESLEGPTLPTARVTSGA